MARSASDGAKRARALAACVVASLAVHVIAVLAVPDVVARAESRLDEIAIELTPLSAEPDAPVDAPRVMGEASPLEPGGADSVQNVAAEDRGVGGERYGAASVVLLLPRADEVTLTDSPLNALGASQAQRIETARDRASEEDRRATPHPDDQPFLASGSGEHPERRPVASVDPIAGARVAPSARTEGAPVRGALQPIYVPEPVAASPSSPAVLAATNAAAEWPAPHVGNSSAVGSERGLPTDRASGDAQASPGVGIVNGQGARESERADVAHGRPAVDLANAATNTAVRDGRVRDSVDSELLATQPRQSIVESTERRGAEVGRGRGGVARAGATGSGGGSREGGQARALGPGNGSWDALDTSDPRYRRWLLEAMARISDAMVFPRARMLAMDQGTSLVRFTVRRDGTLARAPQVIRSSGFQDLDGAAIAAVRGALPLAPLPTDLLPHRPSLVITMPLEFSNPLVR